MSDRLQQIAAEMEKLQADRAAAADRKAKADRFAAAADARLPELEHALREATDRRTAAEGESDQAADALLKATAQRDDNEAKRKTAADDLATALKALDEKKDALTKAEDTLEKLEGEYRTAAAAVETSLQELAGAQTELDGKQNELDGRQNQAGGLQFNLNAAQKAVDDKQAAADGLRDAVEAERQKLAELEAEVARLTAEADTAREELKHVRQLLGEDVTTDAAGEAPPGEPEGDSAPEVSGSKKIPVESLRERRRWLVTEVRRLQPLLNTAVQERDAQRGKVNAAAGQLTSAAGQLADLVKACDAARDRLTAFADTDVKPAVEAVAAARGEVDAARKKYDDSRAAAAERNKPLAGARKDMADARAAYLAAQRDELAKQQALDAAVSALGNAENGVFRRQRDADRALAALAAATAVRDQAGAAVDSLTADRAEARRVAAEAQAALAGFDATEAALQVELAGVVKTEAAPYTTPRPSLVRPLFTISPPPVRLAPVVLAALPKFAAAATADAPNRVLIGLPNRPRGGPITQAEVKAVLEGSGKTVEILRITEELEEGGRLDDVARLILSREDVYTRLLVHALSVRGGFDDRPQVDRAGVIEAIFQLIETVLRREFVKAVAVEVFAEKRLAVPSTLDALAGRLAATNLPLEEGEVQDRVMAAHESTSRQSTLVEAAVLYLQRKRLLTRNG